MGFGLGNGSHPGPAIVEQVMAYFVAKLFATALAFLWPVTTFYIMANGPIHTETGNRVAAAVVSATLFCMIGTLVAIVWTILP